MQKNVMTARFDQLLKVAKSPEALRSRYEQLRKELITAPMWSQGQKFSGRIPRELGRIARDEQREIFESSGIYLWGAGNIVLYVGITRGSFNGRFSRYIWAKRSQCNLARDFELQLKTKGIDGFPAEFRQWYQKIMERIWCGCVRHIVALGI